MASLQNEQIDQSYQGLIKTANNQAGAPFPPVALQYGDGTDTPIEIGDGTGIGVGPIIALKSGTKIINVDSNQITITGLGVVDGAAGTVGMINGAFEFGAGFPGAPATSVDFTNATVTGLPSGSAGLENGTGADSLQSAAALTTNAANASGAQSIALGDGATAPGSNAIAIGKGADTGASSNEVIVIGNSQGGTAASESIRIGHDIPGSSFNSNNVAIGNNFDSVSGNGNVMIGNSASSASDYNTLVGHNTTALFQNGVAIGRDATAGNQAAIIAIGQNATGGAFAGAIALGRNTQANANAAVALGDGVIAATADTVSVKALEVQTDSTPTAGGIIISDAGGTDRRLNIDASGGLQVDSTPVGGGGGAQSYSAIGASAAKGVIPYQANPASQASAYKTNQMLSGYNLSSAGSAVDAAYYQIISLAEGETLSSILLSVQTAAAGSTAEVAIYDLGVGANGITYVNDQLSTLGTIDTSTTGDKIINLGTPFTMPSGKLNGQVAIVVFRSDSVARMKGWSQSVFSGGGGNQVGGIYYRAISPYVDPGVSPGTALPANIGVHGVGGVSYGAQTSNPLMVLYRN